MKLTEEQLFLLQDTLCDRITYRETYEEVYDHMLTALEQSDNNFSLAETATNILLNDFGGFKGLRLIERKRRWLVGRQIVAKQFKYVLAHFKLPLLPITLAVLGLSYYCINELKFNVSVIIIIVASVIIGSGLKYIRYFKRRVILKDAKKSIKDYPLYIITLIPYYVLWLGMALKIQLHKEGHFYSLNLNPLLLSLLFTVYIIYTISFFKLYLEEYKMLGTKLQVK